MFRAVGIPPTSIGFTILILFNGIPRDLVGYTMIQLSNLMGFICISNRIQLTYLGLPYQNGLMMFNGI